MTSTKGNSQAEMASRLRKLISDVPPLPKAEEERREREYQHLKEQLLQTRFYGPRIRAGDESAVRAIHNSSILRRIVT